MSTDKNQEADDSCDIVPYDQWPKSKEGAGGYRIIGIQMNGKFYYHPDYEEEERGTKVDQKLLEPRKPTSHE